MGKSLSGIGDKIMLIKNGFLINPKTGTQKKVDIRIADDIIAEIGELKAVDGETAIDASGMVVAPGLIDTHIHFRDPGFTHKEDLHTGSLAAARGGFTSVICMANTKLLLKRGNLYGWYRILRNTHSVLSADKSRRGQGLRQTGRCR